MKLSNQVRSLIKQSLREDIGSGDMTTRLLVPNQIQAEAFIQAKAPGILCGGAVVREVFRCVDPKVKVSQKLQDGSVLSKGKKVFYFSGRAASILKAERVALNFLSHLSAVATLTSQYVRNLKGTRARVYDTRKTTPLWRELEKYAVATGGGENHRFGLWDEVLVKDNHWVILRHCEGAKQPKQSQNRDCFVGLRPPRNDRPVEIEVANLKELNQLLKGTFLPHRILLDNFSVSNLKKAVKLMRRRNRRIALEASGGITLRNIRQIAKTGVDRISVGALTHSAPSLDFSLTISKVRTRR